MKKATSRRSERLADLVMRELGRLLVEEVQDPRLSLVTVSGVSLNQDLSIALVYLTFDERMHTRDEVMAALERAGGFLRSRLGKALDLRRTPELRFTFDDYLEDMIYDRHGD
jgi:ribosome-binding factor A